MLKTHKYANDPFTKAEEKHRLIAIKKRIRSRVQPTLPTIKKLVRIEQTNGEFETRWNKRCQTEFLTKKKKG